MNFDPAADPWGTAMLASAVLWVLSALIGVVATLAGTTRRAGGRLMLLSLLGFLVAAGGGTWERIQVADAEANKPVPPKPREIVAPKPPADPDDGEVAADDGDEIWADKQPAPEPETDTAVADAPPGDEDPDGDEPVEAIADTPPPPVTPPTPVVDVQLPQVDPLPGDPKEQGKVIRARLRNATRVVDSPRACASIDDVAQAWAELRTVPNEKPWARRAEALVEDLEDCRKRLLYSASRRVRRQHVDARDAFADEAANRFRKDYDLKVAVTISGNSHERLRIGGSGLDAAKAQEIMNGGLQAELVALQFAHVVLSDTKNPKTYTFEVTPDQQLGRPELTAVGLGKPLALPEAP
ncbi:MAG: hypothetical protein AAF799_38335 [Myxococcota bacterium]